ncbi:MAG: lipoprotein insertase outer membrane protein LolB [Alcanivorax sp.]|nr:lipoprotein insertase outer membrane protein LolB [Alcanivorax sp.]
MKPLSFLAVLLFALLQGCASTPDADFVPVSNEQLQQWSVEGRLTLHSDAGKARSYFTYTQLGDDYTLALRPDQRVGKARATLTGKVMASQPAAISGDDDEARQIARQIRDTLPMENLGYWLRALVASGDAQQQVDDRERTEQIREQGWQIRYRDYMRVNDYRLPQRLQMRGPDVRARVDLVRAETGFLTSPCAQESDAPATAPPPRQETVTDLVPADGSAPLPQWINRGDFCRQLKKIHGHKLPDPREGLFGPGSMMWQLTGPLAPAGLGAGRALLLQIAHPWITTAIDEHSIVREDPLKRARLTFRYILTMVYGSTPQAMTAANKVRSIHEQVKGTMPEKAGAFAKGSEYRANEVNAMIWVQATLWDTLVRMYEKERHKLSDKEKEQFYQETKLFAMLFGIPDKALPATWNDFIAYNRAMWDSRLLTVTDRTLQLKKDLFHPHSIWMILPLWGQEILTAANLPPHLRDEFQMKYGWWQKFNNAMLMGSVKVTDFILPDSMTWNPVYHEAEARLKGKRVGWYQRSMISLILGRKRLVN